MDQRIDKTYASLQSSMRALLGTTPWEKITILNLCKNAGVSRTTFYSHFEHKEDLLDSLLQMFEQAMLSDNNARSLSSTHTFKFLPILANHINGNRALFAKTNSTIEGYPVAIRFSAMINRLVATEIEEAQGSLKINPVTQNVLSGGIYNALVQWSMHSKEDTHLGILKEIDLLTKRILQ